MEEQMNKHSSVPLYQQLVETIKQQIRDGELKEGDKLMTEFELSDAYKISRITVRKAIEILVNDGYVIKKQGIGTFVAAKKLNRVMDRTISFTEICEYDGKVASTDVLAMEWVKASILVSQQLQISEGDRVLRMMRLRKSDGVPVMLEESFFSSRYAYLMSEDLRGSMYEILRSHGVEPTHGVKTVEICYATDEEVEYLHVGKNQALLLQYDTVMDEDGERIHFSRLVVNPERYKLTILT